MDKSLVKKVRSFRTIGQFDLRVQPTHGSRNLYPINSFCCNTLEMEGDIASTLPWIEKYRPKDLTELIAHEDIVSTSIIVILFASAKQRSPSLVRKLIEANRLPHLLFYGPPGNGKTSTILAMAKEIYGSHYQMMTLELNASDDRGIDVVRDQIISFASTQKLFSSGVKMVILDEADSMTKVAQFALRRVIEKYSKNTRFCLICNYVSKIIPALQSRCTKFRFVPLKPSQMKDRLSSIAKAEGVDLTPQGMAAIQKISKGDMRKAVNLLQASAFVDHTVTGDVVHSCSGIPTTVDVMQIMKSLLEDSMETALTKIKAYQGDKGLSLVDIVTELSFHVKRLRLHQSIIRILIEGMATIEYNLSSSCDEDVQLLGLIGYFTTVRSMIDAT